jgi:SAM-dependent methyltransferase
MPLSLRHLRLDFAFPDAENDEPHIVVRSPEEGGVIARIATSEHEPRMPLPDASLTSIDARDVLEHGYDEDAWLAELARLLLPGGELTLRVPLDNLTGWLDALNIYRYLGDIAGLGTDREPLETLPGGWHRHYREDDMVAMLTRAGYMTTSIEHEGLPVGELGHLAALVACSFAPDAAARQSRLFAFRERFHHRPLMPLPRAIAGRITVRAARIS